MRANTRLGARPNTCTTGWTDERIKYAIEGRAQGKSAAVVADELGGVTRNAVIGLWTRKGATGPVGKTQRTTDRRAEQIAPYEPRRATIRAPQKPKRGRLAYDLGAGFGRETVNPDALPFLNRKTLVELTSATCRWPIGDPHMPEFFFCGEPPAGDLPYCAYHCRCAYQPLAPSKAKAAEAHYERFA